jgi:hypothetical protein
MLSPVDTNSARRLKRHFTANYRYFVKEGMDMIERHMSVETFRSNAARQRVVMIAAGVAA